MTRTTYWPATTPTPTPTVFLHGLFERPALWTPVIERLGLDPHATLCPTLPGHRAHDTARTATQALTSGAFMDDLADRIDTRFGRPARIVGHSTGGLLALARAERHPDMVRDVVTAGGLFAGHRDAVASRWLRVLRHPRLGPTSFAAMWRLWLSNRMWFERGYAKVMSKASLASVPDALRLSLRCTNPEAIRATALWVSTTCLTAALPRIRQPVLALVGRADPVVPAHHQIKMVQSLPNGQAQVLGGGHLPFYERADQFDTALRGWMYSAQSLPDTRKRPPAASERALSGAVGMRQAETLVCLV